MSEQNELIRFIQEVSDASQLRVEENFGSGFVKLCVSEAERRQAKHDIRFVEDIVIEMLRNARDAGATRIYVSSSKQEDLRQLLFIDDGDGIPLNMHDKIFEPRVTSKLESMVVDSWGVHGRGMALYSIRSNCKAAQVVSSEPDKGSSFMVLADTSALHERADQSSWPELYKDENDAWRITKGPHNIVRTLLQFALEHEHIKVFFGSPTEIAASLYHQALDELQDQQLLFLDELREISLPLRLGTAADSAEFIKLASQYYALELSERSAHRIMSGRIPPLRPALSILKREHKLKPHDQKIDIYKDRRGLKLHNADMEEFSRELEKCFDKLAQRYFIHLQNEPKIRVSKEKIVVSFPFSKEN